MRRYEKPQVLTTTKASSMIKGFDKSTTTPLDGVDGTGSGIYSPGVGYDMDE